LKNLIIVGIAVVVPLLFAAMWIAITSLLSVLSGWFRLMSRFPDRSEQAILQLRGVTGAMGFGVNMRSVLRLDVCASGLRVGIARLLGPFCRDFFVPWEDLRVTRRKTLFWTGVRLEFGCPTVSSLTISTPVADQLARAAARHWPETLTREK